MAIFLNLLLCFSFFFGQLGRVQIGNYSLTYLDITLVPIFLYNLISHLKQPKPTPQNHPFQIFLITAWLIFAFKSTNSFQPTALLYLCRLSILLSFFILPPKFINLKIFHLGIVANIIFGLIQYLYWPDFTAFKSLNWDPHLYRLVSTYFDPTFTALIYLFFIILLFTSHPKVSPLHWSRLMTYVSYIALALTYSRSTLLSLIVVSFYLGYKYKNKLGLLTLALVIATLFLLPRHPGEGTKLERDSSIRAKIVNYQEALTQFTSHPLAGVGYNYLPFVRQNLPDKTHAASGFDSSLLTVLTTTGILGITPFLLGISYLFHHSNTAIRAILIAVLAHSLFANSLLYPWTLVYLAAIYQQQSDPTKYRI